jgi:hypothetical protein
MKQIKTVVKIEPDSINYKHSKYKSSKALSYLYKPSKSLSYLYKEISS